jgi:hypothetical protein
VVDHDVVDALVLSQRGQTENKVIFILRIVNKIWCTYISCMSYDVVCMVCRETQIGSPLDPEGRGTYYFFFREKLSRNFRSLHEMSQLNINSS